MSRVLVIVIGLIGCVAALWASEQPIEVSGSVYRDADGLPVQDAVVTFFDLEDLSRSFQARTSADGQFSLQLGAAQLQKGLPGALRLGQNYPNPFNPSTLVPFELAGDAHVRLEIYNALGQRVRTLVDEVRQAGVYQVPWDARDEGGVGVAAGVYIYRVTVDGASYSRRMALVDGSGATPRSAVSPFSFAREIDASPEEMQRYGVTIYGAGMETFAHPGITVDGSGAHLSFAVEQAGAKPSAKVAATRPLRGDVNNDGRVTVTDALVVATYLLDASLRVPAGGEIDMGDVDRDARLTITDALIIASYALDPSLPSLPSGIGLPRAGQIAIATTESKQFPVVFVHEDGDRMELIHSSSDIEDDYIGYAYFNTAGDTLAVWYGEDDLPRKIYANGITHFFDNYRLDRVDVATIDAEGKRSIRRDVAHGFFALAPAGKMAEDGFFSSVAKFVGKKFVGDYTIEKKGTLLEALAGKLEDVVDGDIKNIIPNAIKKTLEKNPRTEKNKYMRGLLRAGLLAYELIGDYADISDGKYLKTIESVEVAWKGGFGVGEILVEELFPKALDFSDFFLRTFEPEMVKKYEDFVKPELEKRDEETLVRVLEGDGTRDFAEVERDLTPVVELAVNPTSGFAPLAVSFGASASHPTDGTSVRIIKYEWENTGNAESFPQRDENRPRFTATFSEPGIYLISLTVRDDDGNVATASSTIEVKEAMPDSTQDSGEGRAFNEVITAPRITRAEHVGDGVIVLSWSPVEGADLYNIYLSNDGPPDSTDRPWDKTEENEDIEYGGFESGVYYWAVSAIRNKTEQDLGGESKLSSARAVFIGDDKLCDIYSSAFGGTVTTCYSSEAKEFQHRIWIEELDAVGRILRQESLGDEGWARSSWDYTADGILIREDYSFNGLWEGVWRYWDRESGRFQGYKEYRGGVLHGITRYFSSGEGYSVTETRYEYGDITVEKYWNIDGRLSYKVEYIDGQRVSSISCSSDVESYNLTTRSVEGRMTGFETLNEPCPLGFELKPRRE